MVLLLVIFTELLKGWLCQSSVRAGTECQGG